MDNLQEAYLSVYEANAMAKRKLDEPAIRQKIASNTGGGTSADRATALSDKKTYGQSGVDPQARERLARTQRGDFRKTTSSNFGLHVGQHKSNDPRVQALQSARGAQRGVLTPVEKKQLNREEFDLFDYLLEYLVAEGYADTNQNAIAIMANMSEEWRENIVEAVRGSQRSIANIITGNDIRGVTRGEKPVYKKPKWKDNVENKVQGGSQLRKQGEIQNTNDRRDRERIEANKKSIQRLNAKPGEDSGDYDDSYHGDDDTSDGNRHYSLGRTNRSARKRRASGR